MKVGNPVSKAMLIGKNSSPKCMGWGMQTYGPVDTKRFVSKRGTSPIYPSFAGHLPVFLLTRIIAKKNNIPGGKVNR